MASRKHIVNVGPVGRTSVHNHTQFLLMVIVVIGIACLLWWGYAEGNVERIANGSGPHFTALFTALLLASVAKGLVDAWHLSADYDKIKEVGGDTEKLKELFAIPGRLTVRDVDMVKEEFKERMEYKLGFLCFMSTTSFGFGLLGTFIGLADKALKAFEGIEINAEGVASSWSPFIGGIQLALQTSIAGFWVGLMVMSIVLMLGFSAILFRSRLARALEEGVKKESSS